MRLLVGQINVGLLALGNVINALADEERLAKGKQVRLPPAATPGPCMAAPSFITHVPCGQRAGACALPAIQADEAAAGRAGRQQPDPLPRYQPPAHTAVVWLIIIYLIIIYGPSC